MIPEKLNFVEKKNTKNTTISEKSVEKSKKCDKNTPFSGETPSLSKGGLAIPTADHPLPTTPSKRKSISVENTTTRAFHYEIHLFFTTKTDMRNITDNPCAY